MRTSWLLVLTACAACASSQAGGRDAAGADARPVDAAGAPVDAAAPPVDAPVVVDALAPPPDAAWADATTMCGNGLVEGGEECDDANGVDTDACRNGCAWARCGDGVIRTGAEECDDGNTVDGDACSSICLACAGGDARFTWTGNAHCYTRIDALATWSAAAAACPGRSYLVTYELAAENAAVTAALLGGSSNYWIGFGDAAAESMFRWITDEPVIYTNWEPGEPNDSGGIEDCTEQYVGGTWNDLYCDDARGSICEDEGWIVRADDRHAYRYVFRRVAWSAALADCAMLGGHLATITSAAEQSFVSARVRGNLWIGAGDAAVENTFTWVTGEAFVFDAFAPGEPNDTPPGEDCVEIRADATWNDENCDSLRGYVCEID